MIQTDRAQQVRKLHAARPRSPFLRISALALAALAGYAWLSGEIEVGNLFSARRAANFERFLENDALPFPLRDDSSTETLWSWSTSILTERGLSAALATLAISVLAIALAAGAAALLAPFGSRVWMARGSGGLRAFSARLVRTLFIALRAIPELIWAFLLLGMLGPGAWPAVLALAIHNSGILGRLGSETLDNLDPRPALALQALGASRARIAWSALRPAAFPRFVLYVLYRYETCVREATVLGMLGVVSLGYWIQDARARQRYDELLLLVALSALLVLLGDLASGLARNWVRRARS